ncbi:MAG: MFS transporter [Coriobacteriales bacterium]|nr:MFS transporter [Coriobacteriales bacterium]
MRRSPKIFTARFVGISVVNLINALNYWMVGAMIVGFTMDTFDADSAVGGIVFGMFIVGALASRFFAGKLLMLMGNRFALLTGLALDFAACAAYVFVPDANLLCVVRFIHGLGFGILTTAAPTIVGQMLDRDVIGRGMAYHSLGPPIAAGIGPMLGLTFAASGNHYLTFYACLVLFVIAGIIIFALRLEPHDKGGKAAVSARGFSLRSFFDGKSVRLGVMISLCWFAVGSLISFCQKFCEWLGVPEVATVFFVAYSICMIATRPLVGSLFDKKGMSFVAVPASIILTLAFALLAFTHGIVGLLVSAGLASIGIGALQTAAFAQVAKQTPRERLGLANNTFFLFLDGGSACGPTVFGFLLLSLNYNQAFLAMAGLMIVATLFLIFVARKR